MADVITRLVVDSQDYDAKIKRASQGLQRYAEECRRTGGTLEYVDDEAMKFARDLGKMDTAASTARQRLREYTEAITGLTATYRAMTDAEKSSEFGKALSASIDQLKAKAAELQDIMGDTQREIQNLASDTSFTDGVNLMTRTIGSCMAAMSAWSGESKEMDAVIKDLAKIGTTVAAVEALTKAFQKQNLVLLKNPYVASAAAVVALGVALAKVVKSMNELSPAQKALNDAQLAGVQNAAKESMQLQTLDSIMRDSNRSYDERLDALEKIKAIVPDYHGALTEEGILINDNVGAMDDYIKSLERAAIAQASFDKMVELQKQKQATQLKAQDLQSKVSAAEANFNASKGGGSTQELELAGMSNLFSGTGELLDKTALSKAYKEIDDINSQIEALRSLVRASDIEVNTDNDVAGEVSSKPVKVKVEPELPEGSIAALRKQLSDLTTEWEMAGSDDSRSVLKEQIDEVTAALDKMMGKAKEAKQAVMVEGPSGYSEEGINALREQIRQSMKGMQLGSSEYMIQAQNLIDLTTFENLVKAAMQRGLQLDPMALESMFEQIDAAAFTINPELSVSNEAWQSLVDEINAKLAELQLDPIKLDVNTGAVGDATEEAEKMNGSWQAAARAVSQVGSAMQSIDDPAAKVAGIIASAIANVALGVGELLSRPENVAQSWGWIALAGTATATMISTIAAIKSATAGSYASGGMIPGNSYSGDNLTANVNAGEVILNRAQQSNIAGQLESSNPLRNLRLETDISGQNLRIVLNNDNRSRGGSRNFYSKIH